VSSNSIHITTTLSEKWSQLCTYYFYVCTCTNL